MSRWITDWRPDDETFWRERGSAIARRNLTFSIFAEFLGFSVWLVWSIVAANLNDAGFDLTVSQLFWLVSVPALVGATLRFPYTFAVARFGGRNWTVVSALLLLIPVVLLAVMVSDPQTPYGLLLVAAATAGFGGGNFASSMANISYFYPDARKGFPLGLNAAGGNIGVAVVQAFVPLVITVAIVGGQVGGGPFLANAGLIFIPLIVLAAACAFFFMDNLRVSRSELREQLRVARNGHTWLMSVLYIGTFGSFIGYSGALPILLSLNFPDAGLKLAFLGALVGSLARPIGGLLSDRFGGARVTLGNFGVMIVAALGVIFCLQNKAEPWAFTAFLGMFMVLFMATGIGNGSTFRMIPVIFRAQALDRNRGDREQAIRIGKRETAAVLGVSSAIGAYGGFLIPQGFSLSRTATGGPQAALYVFIGFYLICAAITWWCYVRQREVAGRRPVLGEARA
ncbi:MAG: MFS transporter [Actinomycetota bacterium]|nr:MFS transporter [Actinomycetota bacterium]MDQ3355532.1 MFS transporter [Actinomycetota bacterium]